MTGQELVKLRDLDIFKTTVMDTVINEFEPDPAKRSGYYPAPGRSWRVGGFYRY